MKSADALGHPLTLAQTLSQGCALIHVLRTDSEGEAALLKAIDVAQRQSAKSWELRATTSLARLRRWQGRREEAVEVLAPLLGWFEEGSETVDLKTARLLLKELETPKRMLN